MDFFLDALAFAVGVLQFTTVVLIIFGPVRKYTFVLGYCLLQLSTSLTEIVIARRFGIGSRGFGLVFWTDEIVLDVVLFFILILLTYRAMEGSPAQGPMGRMLGGVTLIVLVLPFVLFKGAFVKLAWFDHASQVLNFGAAILNLGLWSALLGTGRRDTQLLTVSAGFGIVATGAAISFGLRRIIHAHGTGPHGWAWVAANLVFVLAHLAGAAILCWAFRRSFSGRTRGSIGEAIWLP